MSVIFKKLNLKDQDEIVVLNAPQSFEPEIGSLTGIQVLRDTAAAHKIVYVISFVTWEEQVAEITKSIIPKIEGDATVWFVYPKKSSKQYKSEINRDRGWAALGQAGFEPVRQVAIDADWSALRFRQVQYIKTMKRSKNMAISKQGKEKSGK
jgi:hypothetical protein